ncbi:hypothetical protein DDE74_04155 [Streptomyces lydicus]|uniref:Uncharacterized protein n=1 Tax=Streptomyces lydicus TaxID=47763 RepID=A0A3Q9K6W5_9ACTN|nr:hypothetical protein DDE74_04155 [Streptomyces lydicus]
MPVMVSSYGSCRVGRLAAGGGGTCGGADDDGDGTGRGGAGRGGLRVGGRRLPAGQRGWAAAGPVRPAIPAGRPPTSRSRQWRPVAAGRSSAGPRRGR